MTKILLPVLAIAVGLLFTGCSNTNSRNRSADTGNTGNGKTADHTGAMAGTGGVTSGQGTLSGNGSGSGTGTNTDRSNPNSAAPGMGDTSTGSRSSSQQKGDRP